MSPCRSIALRTVSAHSQSLPFAGTKVQSVHGALPLRLAEFIGSPLLFSLAESFKGVVDAATKSAAPESFSIYNCPLWNLQHGVIRNYLISRSCSITAASVFASTNVAISSIRLSAIARFGTIAATPMTMI